jgi:hypothetical protein
MLSILQLLVFMTVGSSEGSQRGWFKAVFCAPSMGYIFAAV